MSELRDWLAVFRLTRLVTDDQVTEPLRGPLQARLRDSGHGGAAYWLGCAWCVSPYVAAAVVLVVRRRPWWPLAADALAASAVTGIAAGLPR